MGNQQQPNVAVASSPPQPVVNQIRDEDPVIKSEPVMTPLSVAETDSAIIREGKADIHSEPALPVAPPSGPTAHEPPIIVSNEPKTYATLVKSGGGGMGSFAMAANTQNKPQSISPPPQIMKPMDNRDR